MRTSRMIFTGIGVLAAGALAASPASAGSSTGTEEFTVVNTSSADNAVAPISAIGPIHAHGRDVQLTSTKDRFVFPAGAIIVVHKATKNSQSFDPGSCLARFTQQGKYQVISGTGAYAKVAGSGTFTVTGYFIGCGKTAAASSVIIQAGGPLSY